MINFCSKCPVYQIDKDVHRSLKKLCLYHYGLGFLFATPKIRAFLLDSMREFLEELSKW